VDVANTSTPSSERRPASPLQTEIERLRAQLTERDDLLMTIAHELRNPLHGVMLQLALARRACEADQAREATGRIARTQEALERYALRLSMLLELTRSSDFPLQAKAVDLVQVIHAVVGGTRHEARARGIDVHVQGPATCLMSTDASAIEQVLENLVLNAFRHAACKNITLVLRPGEHGVEIAVSDDGHGVSLEDQEHIFTRMGVATHTARGNGSGLGLWIVRKLLAALKGSITLHSRPGEGATFTVSLPLQ
jgi:two-component system OmpR family sensor kinase